MGLSLVGCQGIDFTVHAQKCDGRMDNTIMYCYTKCVMYTDLCVLVCVQCVSVLQVCVMGKYRNLLLV